MRNTNIKWTFNKCKEEALKYSTRTEFHNRCQGAYNAARKNKWLDDICSHMKSKQKPYKFWTYENCKKEALKYNYKKDFYMTRQRKHRSL
jgi:hypothetical protein